jgi:predicted CXXCH cytochrome family protein
MAGVLVVSIAGMGVLYFQKAESASSVDVAAPNKEDCASCHAEIYTAWHKSLHSDLHTSVVREKETDCLACHQSIPTGNMTAMTSTGKSYEESWSGKGKPNECMMCHSTGYNIANSTWKAEGITCEACHNPIEADHPDKNMPKPESTETCRNCHSEDRFAWESWTSSVHYQKDMTCTTCHNPHTTELKVVNTSGSSPICENCHKSQSQSATHSAHADAGVSCIQCHLGEPKGDDQFHVVPDHSFIPSVETCNGCHEKQMHNAGEVTTPGMPNSSVKGIPMANAKADAIKKEFFSIETPNRTDAKTPTSSMSVFGFTGMASFLGLVCGVGLRNIRRK